jgi:SAM-dependent methyltransferase
MKKSSDYHDYSIKDGKLIGEFEDMYRHSAQVPWHQDKVMERYCVRICFNIIEYVLEKGVKSVLEVGCGYGYVLSKLKRNGISLSGFDISATAIARASRFHPGINFFVDDLKALNHKKKYGLVICREVLWYVLNDFDAAVNNLCSLMEDAGYIFIGVSFPDLKKPYFGKELLPGSEELIKILNERFEGLAVNIHYNLECKNDGPTVSYLGRKKP